MESNDPEFSVRLLTFEDVERLNEEARMNGMSARWSSSAVLRAEVNENSMAIACPCLPEWSDSYRCYLYYRSNSARRGVVTLFDISIGSFSELRKVTSIGEFNKVVQVLIASYEYVRKH
jgi:hypothetical protein